MIPCGENSKVALTVKNFIAAHRIPHAMLIEGENTNDNLNLAQHIAKAAVCQNNNAPCGVCKECHLAEIDAHPDITRVDTLDGKKFLSVAQIRDVRADAFVKAHSGARRVFIIENAHRMNEQAQNALLKVLEEPPKDVVFLLLASSKTMLLDTIISRCVLLSLLAAKNDDNKHISTANTFIDLLLSGSEYDMLKLLTPLEKSRTEAEDFFNTLSLCITQRLKKSPSHARVLDRLFDDTKYYLDLLATNINMTLLLSLVVSRSKGLLDI